METHTRAGTGSLDAGMAAADVLTVMTVTKMPARHPG
jgi:hypothetical protein